MVINFEIEGIFRVTNRGYFIAAKCLEEKKEFWVTENSRLGNIKIDKWFDIPRAIDNEGKQRMDLYFFHIKNEDDKDKLKQGEIVQLLPANKIEFLMPWVQIKDLNGYLEEELKRELHEQHILFGKTVKEIARRQDCDDVLFKLDNEEYAVVHLTFSGKKENSKDYPDTQIFKHWTEVYEKVIIEDSKEYED